MSILIGIGIGLAVAAFLILAAVALTARWAKREFEDLRIL